MAQDRLAREQSFHDERFKGDGGSRKKATKYYTIQKSVWVRYAEVGSKYCNNAQLLEYGCGRGSLQWLKAGAKLTGIDISPEGIEKAKENIASTAYEANYLVRDCENTEFDASSFDVVVGSGIIHHLDLSRSYRELARILKPDGHAVFVEPLGHNPFINLYRALTPQMRTEDEHPLMQKDLRLLNEFFHTVEIDYFSLFTLFAVPFRNWGMFEKLCGYLGSVDNAVFRIPFFRKYAWTVVIHASNPRK